MPSSSPSSTSSHAAGMSVLHSRQARLTSDAPSLRATRAQSKATLPPPSTMTPPAHGHVRSHVDFFKEIDIHEDAFLVCPGDGEPLAFVGTHGHECCIEALFEEHVYRFHAGARPYLHPHGPYFLDLPVGVCPWGGGTRECRSASCPLPKAGPRKQ